MRAEHADDTGLTLVEVLIAAAITVVVATGVTGAIAASVVRAVRARERTLAVMLATERMEQLRSLAWGYGDAAVPVPVTDASTDLAVTPAGSGGPGLAVAPSSSLAANSGGYTDHLDGVGRWIGSGAVAPPGTAFTRRWRVSRVPGATDSLVLEVVVKRARGAVVSRPDDVRLITIKSRKGG